MVQNSFAQQNVRYLDPDSYLEEKFHIKDESGFNLFRAAAGGIFGHETPGDTSWSLDYGFSILGISRSQIGIEIVDEQSRYVSNKTLYDIYSNGYYIWIPYTNLYYAHQNIESIYVNPLNIDTQGKKFEARNLSGGVDKLTYLLGIKTIFLGTSIGKINCSFETHRTLGSKTIDVDSFFFESQVSFFFYI